MGIYLSIDLDYWKEHRSSRSAVDFFKKVLELNVPVTFVIEHEELISDVNRIKKLIELYNVDYHSDIIAQWDIGKEPEDYDWANYIKGRTQSRYVWVMPDPDCYHKEQGTCHGDGDNPFYPQKNSGWKKCHIQTGPRNLPWNNIERVGVCLSPCFVCLDNVKPVIRRLGVNIKMVEKLIEKQPYLHHKRKRGVLSEIAA